MSGKSRIWLALVIDKDVTFYYQRIKTKIQ